MSFFRNWFYLYVRPVPAEAAFEAHLVKLGEPYRTQYPFPKIRRVADFTLHLRKVVIEVDGASHSEPVQRYKDLASSIALEKAGWRVIRFTNAEVLHPGFQISNLALNTRIEARPSLPELESALSTLLQEHPELSKPLAKRRKQKTKPAPKTAQKRRAAQDKTD